MLSDTFKWLKRPGSTHVGQARGYQRLQGLGLALILAFSMLLAPTGVATGAGSAAEVTLAQSTDVDNWDPFGDNTTSIINIKRNVYETLTTRDNQLALAPLLAAQWKLINPTTWRFALRRNVTFHNGDPLTAEDVRYSLERQITQKLLCSSWVATISKVDVVDPHTVDIHTHAQDVILPARLSFCAFIVPSKLAQEKGLSWLTEHPTGTGPFRFVSWRRDQGSVLERSPSYWGKSAIPMRVKFVPIPEASSRVAALLAGQVDVAGGIPTDLIPRLKQDKRVNVQTVRNDRVYFIILNAHVHPFDNRAVRQAMNYGLNVQAMVDFLFKDHASRIPTICGSMWDGCDTKQAPYRYDPGRARQLLREAGYPNGFETTMAISPQRPTAATDVAQSIALQLRQVGVKIKIEPYEWGNLVQNWLQVKSPMYYMSFGSPVLDIDDIIGGYFDPGRRALWYTPPENLVKLVRQGTQTADPAARKALYRQFLAGIKDDAPWLFLWNLDDVTGVNASVSGFVPRSDEMWDIAQIQK